MSRAPCHWKMSLKGLANEHGCVFTPMPRRLMLDHLIGPVQSVGGRNLIPFTPELCNLRK